MKGAEARGCEMYLAHYISHWKKSNLGITVYLYTMRRDQFEPVARYQITLHLMMSLHK